MLPVLKEGMVEVTDLEVGDELSYELTTVYQSGDDPDPYTGTWTVASVELEENDDGETAAVNVYTTHRIEENDGFATRRIRLEGDELRYEQARGDPKNPTWSKYARDGGLSLERAKCGAKTESGTCGMVAGWGTRHAGRGKCKHHDTNETAPNVDVGPGVSAVLGE